MNNDASPLMLDLTADHAQFRSLTETDWTTLRGKHNRIAIGSPLCEAVKSVTKGGLLTKENLHHFPLSDHEFYQLSLALTLVPDVECQFRSVDFLMDLAGIPGQKRLPVFARLEPQKEVSKEALKLSTTDSAKLGVKDNAFQLVTAELGGSKSVEKEFEKIHVELASFGTSTRSAGWRYKLTESKEIPLNSADLKALVIVPQGRGGKINFRVTAQIEVKTAIDRILTKLFLREPRAGTSADYEFP